MTKLKLNINKNQGFTLIEILVVAAVTGIITSFMIINFQRTRLDLNESASEFIGAVRAARSKANASAKLDDNLGSGFVIRCGYGIHYEGPISYSTYVGPDATLNDCSAQNRNFGVNDVRVLPIKKFAESRVEFKGAFSDIFFEPPFSTTYIDNSSANNTIPITIGKIGGVCPQECKTINVSTSGTIQ